MIRPGQQLVDAVDLVLGNAAENIGEPGLWIDLIELGCLDQRIGSRRGPAASLRSGEKPIFPADRYAPHTPFCRIVVDARIADRVTFQDFLQRVILPLPGVRETHSYASIGDVKPDALLPL